MESSEHQWVSRAQTGDRDAFGQLVEAYWDRVCRWLYGLTGNAHAAEDLTQEVFLKAWSGLSGLERHAVFRSWLYRIAKNSFLDYERRHKQTQPLTDEPETDGQMPLGSLLEQETQQMLQRAVSELRGHYRSAYLLWTQEDLSYSEIAQILETTEETARWRVCKARQLLLSKLKPYLDAPEP